MPPVRRSRRVTIRSAHTSHTAFLDRQDRTIHHTVLFFSKKKAKSIFAPANPFCAQIQYRNYIRAYESAIIQLIRRRVLFLSIFRHNTAENGPQVLKMIQKDASSNSTQSVIKSAPKQKYKESYGYFPRMPAVRPLELRIRRICVCVTHIQLLTGAVSREPPQIET
jgi:hypothetical protein